MIGMNHGDFDVADGLGPTFVHGRRLLGALFLHPNAEFEDPHDNWVVLLDDFDCVSDVVEVTMGAEQNVDLLHFLFGFRAHRITHNPWINDDGCTGGSLDTESRMSQPREFNAFQIHSVPSSQLPPA